VREAGGGGGGRRCYLPDITAAHGLEDHPQIGTTEALVPDSVLLVLLLHESGQSHKHHVEEPAPA
jgi:hypothetical protein